MTCCGPAVLAVAPAVLDLDPAVVAVELAVDTLGVCLAAALVARRVWASGVNRDKQVLPGLFNLA